MTSSTTQGYTILLKGAVATFAPGLGIEVEQAWRQRQGGTTVIRVNFRVTDEYLCSKDPLRVRAAIVADIIIPLARQMRLKLQCGLATFSSVFGEDAIAPEMAS